MTLFHRRVRHLCAGAIQNTFTVDMQGVSRLEDITAAGDFLGLSDQKSSYKHVSDFGRDRKSVV